MNDTVKQFVKYCAVGATGVVINLGFTYYLTESLNIWYMASNAVGIGVAVVTNFALNKWWTFKA